MTKNAWDAWGESEESTGEYTQSTSFDPIPEGTRCAVEMEEIKFDSFPGSSHEHINIKWKIDEPEEYDRRKFFQTIQINGTDPNSQYYKEEKQQKIIETARKMFFAIDKNAGGYIAALRRKPTTEELQKYLIGARMMVLLGVYNEKNVVRSISPLDKTEEPKPQASKLKPKPADDEDDDIPF